MKPLPKTSITIKILSNTYTINYPDNEKFLIIESLKWDLSHGRYNDMCSCDATKQLIGRHTVDMIALFRVCCPEIEKDLVNKSFLRGLDVITNRKILSVYVKQIMPWLAEWDVVLNADEEEVVPTSSTEANGSEEA